ncbi:MAG: hypothetical protein JWP86_2951, partial [Phenylobacterium sp.]|nr:hypothetical protein [Phenylobacterium sp.]
GPLVPPGHYQVKLTVGGQTRTAPLVVAVDPRAKDAEPAIRAKTELAMATLADIDRLHRAVNAVRGTEADLDRATKDLAGKPSQAALLAQAGKLKSRFASVEGKLMQVDMKGSEANLAFPGMLNEQFASFALIIEDADTPPTAAQQALYQSLHAQLDAELVALRALQGADLVAFNAKLATSGVSAAK